MTQPQYLVQNPYPIFPLTFTQDNVAASQTDVQLNVAEVASAATLAVDGITMPWAGIVIGISYNLSAAATAGSMTVGATVNGTEAADPTLTVTTAASGYDLAVRGAATFVAGDRIGAEITTNGSWDATTSDLAVTVWVMAQVTGI